MIKAELIIDQKAVLGEGPIWDSRSNVLYWVDILKNALYTYSPKTNHNAIMDTGQNVGTVVVRERGGVVLAMEHGFYFADPASKSLEFIRDPEQNEPDSRFNDGKCDPAGRFWAGGLNTKGKPGVCALYRLDADCSVHKMLDGVTISNGICWSADAKTMYYIDTPHKKVWAFDYDNETGNIKNRRAAIDTEAEEGHLDGMTMDQNGNLWIAHWGGFKVTCWDPISAKKLNEIHVPCPHVTACAFGGEALKDLYITTAAVDLSQEQLTQYPLSGGLFVAAPGVKGVRSFEFKG